MTKNNAFQCSPHNIPVTSEDKSFMNESINVIINGNKAIAYDFPIFSFSFSYNPLLPCG